MRRCAPYPPVHRCEQGVFMSKGVLLMECARTGVAPATPAAASTPTRPATPAALALLLLTCLMAAAVLAPASFAASALAAEATSPSETPQRIVSLAPSNTEILFNLGLGLSIVGVTTACDYPAEASSIDKIGDYNINVEAVVAKQPDLVVAVSDLQAQVIDKLRELGLNVVAVNPTTIPEVFDAIQTIGDATGRSAAARELVAELRSQDGSGEGARSRHPRKRPSAGVCGDLERSTYDRRPRNLRRRPGARRGRDQHIRLRQRLAAGEPRVGHHREAQRGDTYFIQPRRGHGAFALANRACAGYRTGV